MRYAETNFKEHGWSNWSLMPFGHGNGGGGPTREMMERARRMADLDGVTPVSVGTAEQFFGNVEAEAAAGAPVPVWAGELYFEMHRGTLTSQSATKVGNRRCERLLREAELWLVAAGGATPELTSELETLWKDVLLQQFHDIIPGSSIAWVADDAEAAHTRVAERLETIITDALATIAPAGTSVANAATHARREVIVIDGEPTMVEVPGSGIATASATAVDDHRVVVTERSMNNGLISVAWNLDGEMTSIIDIVRGRQLLPAGARITLQLAPDHPVEYDAWDLESWTRSLGVAVAGATSMQFATRHPLLAELVVRREFGTSSLVQTYTMPRWIRAARHPLRHRLARRREVALPEGADRRAHPRGQLRHPVRSREATDARQQLVGCRQVRGVRTSLRRLQRTVLRRRRAQRRSVRARCAGRRCERVVATGREVSRSRCRPRTARRDDQRAASRARPPRCAARGRRAQPAAAAGDLRQRRCRRRCRW